MDMKEELSKENIEKILNIKKEINDPFYDEKPKKIIDCPHEIVFNVNATVLTQNEKGELVSTKEICAKNYHIPVPIEHDYHVYMTTFFEYLEKKIVEGINDTDQNLSKENK